MIPRTASFALLSALAAPLASQQTWTVDDDAPADFTSVQLAVDAASDGDTIVVRPGLYGAVAIDGKGLTIQGEGAAVLQVVIAQIPTLKVTNLAADQTLYLRGFDLTAFGTFETTTTRIESCAGPVLLEDCFVSGAGVPVSVKSCASVTFSRCDLIAPATFANYSAFTFFGFAPYLGLAVTDSTAFLYDCEVRGSNGSNAAQDFIITIPPAPSAAALSVAGSTVLATGCTFAGGKGGGGTTSLCYAGEDGSPGIRVGGGFLAPSGTANLLDCTVTGGLGGIGTCGLADGLDAPPIEIDSGVANTLLGTARSFDGSSPAVEGGNVAVHLVGEPGDAVILYVQLAAAPGIFLPDYALAFHLPLPTAVVGLGAIPPGGVLDLSIPVPDLSPGVDSFRFVGQALFVGATGFFEGGPSTLLLVDSAL